MLKKIAVLVSGGGTNLEAILDAQTNGIIKSGKVQLVISNNANSYALTRALNHGIESKVLTKNKGYDSEFEQNLIKTLKSHQIDLIVLAGFMCILSKKFTEQFKNQIINVHPSLIPSFCGEGYYGLTVHKRALEKGVKVTGATVHYVNEVPDGGAIIMQKAVEVCHGDTPEILQKRVMEQAEWIILPQAIEQICKG